MRIEGSLLEVEALVLAQVLQSEPTKRRLKKPHAGHS